MSWLKRPPTLEQKAAEAQTVRLDQAREDRKFALNRLLAKLAEIPIEEGMVHVGEVLGREIKK